MATQASASSLLVTSPDLLPDLVADPPTNAQAPAVMQLADGQNHLLLKFNGSIHNIGAGPLEMRGSMPVNGEMTVTGQRIYRQDSTFYDDTSRHPVIRFETTDGHDHWHLMNAVRWSLWNQGGTAEVAPAAKVGFCLEDGEAVDSFASPTPAYTSTQTQRCKEGQPNATSVFQGISSGWRDVYGTNVYFQWVDVSDVAPGLYRLGSEMDPDDFVKEQNEQNNGPTLATSTVTVPGYTASPVSASVTGPATITLSAQKYGSPGSRLFKIVTAPSHGTLNVAVGSSFAGPDVTYTPNPGYTGPDSFTFAAFDSASPYPLNPPMATASVTVQSLWTAPVTLSDPGQSASLPQVGLDANGNAVFVWKRFDASSATCCDRIEARTRSSAGTLGAVETLSDPGQNADAPRVAVAPNGDAVFAWTRSDGTNTRVEARARSAGGSSSAVQTLSAAGQNATEPRVGIDSLGNAVFAWTRSDGTNTRIQTSARSSNGTLSAPQTLSTGGENASQPQITVDSNGNAAFAWTRFDGTNKRVQARIRSAAGALSATQTLTSPGQDASNPQVALDQGGTASFVWERFDGANSRIRGSTRSAAGALSTSEAFSAAGQDAFDPQVGVDQSGNGVFAWTRFDGTNNRIQARARSTAGTLSAVETLSAAGQDASQPQVAVDPNDNSVFVWRRFGGTNNRIQARARSAAGVLGPVRTLSDPGQSASLPQVAVDDVGNAVAVWERFDGSHERIQAAASP